MVLLLAVPKNVHFAIQTLVKTAAYVKKVGQCFDVSAPRVMEEGIAVNS